MYSPSFKQAFEITTLIDQPGMELPGQALYRRFQKEIWLGLQVSRLTTLGGLKHSIWLQMALNF
jgi:hypothetical protein